MIQQEVRAVISQKEAATGQQLVQKEFDNSSVWRMMQVIAERGLGALHQMTWRPTGEGRHPQQVGGSRGGCTR
jgi:hypothetical protein